MQVAGGRAGIWIGALPQVLHRHHRHRHLLPAICAQRRGRTGAREEGGAPSLRGLTYSKRNKTGRGGKSNARGGGSSTQESRSRTLPSKGFGGPRPRGNDSDDEDQYIQDGWKSSEDDEGMISGALGELSDSEVAELLGQDVAGPDAFAGVNAQVEADLTETLAEFPFELDAFQVSSVRRILSGRSVVVCAPTGAGKTAIAEAAATHFLRRGGRVLYTTPLKALSNQKLGELRERFGVNQSGLQTGDASINIDADIVVMTTEILRNILYRTRGEDKDASLATTTTNGIGERGAGDSAADRLQGVRLVVFDECHYLGDPGRGSAWEECIINLPSNILILAMSATVRNPLDLSGWISAVHGECDTVTTSFRPVPLKWQFCMSCDQQQEQATLLLPLLDPRGRALNPQLLPPSERLEAAAMKEDEWSRWDDLAEGDPRERRANNNNNNNWRRGSMRTRTLDELVGVVNGGELEEPWHRMPKWKRVPLMESVVGELRRKEMLPAIWFIFSRKECDASTARLDTAGIRLTTPEEQDAILAEVAALRAEQPEGVKEAAVPALVSGLAAHHAGCLPGWKALVERLFQRGLVKLVFATETLAAGINMPARTTLLSALSRRRDAGIVSLTHNELLQMAGRAGRRGYDTLGYCVVVQNRWEGPEFAFNLIRKGPEPLRSQFTTSYGMALNLLWSKSMEESREFLTRSFSSYLGGAGAQRARDEIETLEARAKTIMDDVARRTTTHGVVVVTTGDGDSDDDSSSFGDAMHAPLDLDAETVWMRYQKLQGRRREEKRAARLLRAQLAEERGTLAHARLVQSGLPRGVGLDLSGSNIDDSSYRMPALAVACLGLPTGSRGAATSSPSYLCLGIDNTLYVVQARHISAMTAVDQEEGVDGGLKKGDDDDGLFVEDVDLERHDDAAFTVQEYADSLRRGAWRELPGGVSAANGSALTASFAITSIPPASSLTPLQPSEDGLRALAQQRARIADVKRELEAMRSDKAFAKASKRYSQAASKAGVLLERAETLREQLEGRLVGGWREFEDVVNVLEGAFAVSPPTVTNDGVRPDPMRRRTFSPLGLVAREMRGSNELWMAMALTHPALQTLSAPKLAAVMSAIVAPEAFNRASNIFVAYPPSPEVIAAVEALEPARSELMVVQVQSGLEAPIALDLRFAGVVEAWASGIGWTELTTDCGLDDGDVARLLMRTVDVLRQAAFCDHLVPTLRRAARGASRVMNRTPISDLIT